MKNIEIITAQNVVLQYELAGFRDRALAFVIDLVCLMISIGILSAVGTGIAGGSQTAQTIVSIFVSCIFIFYSLLFELWNKGQSIGKMAMRIQVIKMAGGHATFSDYLARWVFRLIDIYLSLGAVASMLIVSSSKGQRIGDVVANTAVVKLASKMNLSLQDLLAIHEQKTYTPQYVQSRKLHEEDALLIKQTLDHYRRFKNDAHREAVELLTERVKKVLDIDYDGNDDLKFLQTVLQDYVVLTR
ncbi:MAG: RDD family protein [Chryseolinea sp.]